MKKQKFKKTFACLIAAAFFFAMLTSCGASDSAGEPALSVGEVVSAVVSSTMEETGDNAEWLDQSDAERLAIYVEAAYGLTSEEWSDCAILRETGASAREIAALLFTDEKAAEHGEECLKEYLHARAGVFAGYDPDQAALAENGVVCRKGLYVGLFICASPENAREAFLAALRGELKPDTSFFAPVGSSSVPTPSDASQDSMPEDTVDSGSETSSVSETEKPLAPVTYPGRTAFDPPLQDDMSVYDTSAILDAWVNGDSTGLSEYDGAILNEAEKVLGEILRQDMSDFEKEKAIYSWVADTVDYDYSHYDIMTETPRESYTPYGGLINHSAVCLGFATTFQLLMDMEGIECITVIGAAYKSGEDHAWNMVRLDGEWYCADTTWDDSFAQSHLAFVLPTFFNVTSDYMAATDHQWNYDVVPEATAEDRGIR